MIPALLAIAFVPQTPASPAPGQGTPPAVPQDKRSKQEIQHQADIDRDTQIGKKYTAEVAKEFDIVDDPVNMARINRIGGELAAIANSNQVTASWGDKRLNPFHYEFHIVRPKDKDLAEDVNAFSLPGGYIYVYEGLIKFAESDDELAGVLAHEIAHAAFRHVATLQREQSKLSAIQIPLVILAIFTGGAAGAADALGVGGLATTAVGNGWSVKAEQAADYGGFQYLLKSKYDPTGMLTFMERLAGREKRQLMGMDLGIYRTHPPGRERAESLIQHMKEADVPIRRSRVASSYRVETKPGADGTVQLEMAGRPIVALAGDNAAKRAAAAAVSMNEFFDTVPDAYEMRAEDDGKIFGRRKEIVTLTPADAAANKTTIPDLQKSTLEHMRIALFTIGYRVWDAK